MSKIDELIFELYSGIPDRKKIKSQILEEILEVLPEEVGIIKDTSGKIRNYWFTDEVTQKIKELFE